MNPNINWDEFEDVDESQQSEVPENGTIDWDKFEDVEPSKKTDLTSKEPKKKTLQDLGWLERNFTSEGQNLVAQENRNVLKGVASGTTAGFSELIPGFEVEDTGGGSIGKVAGSLLPIGAAAKAIAYPLQLAAKAAPKLAKPVQWLGNLLGISGAGGLYEGLEESAQKTLEKGEFVPPSLETIEKEGVKWGVLDLALQGLGLTGRFAKALYNRASKVGEPVVDVLTNVIKEIGGGDKIAEKAISILEDKPLQQIQKEIRLSQPEAPSKTENLATYEFGQRVKEKTADLRTKKIAQEDFTKLESFAPEPYLPAEFKAEKIVEEAMSTELTERIEGHSQRAATEKELGESVQKDIERTIKERKAKTDADYAIAKEVEAGKRPNFKTTANTIVEEIKMIQSGGLNLTPEGYKKAEKQLIDTLTDIGYGVETGSNGEIIRAVKSHDVPLSQGVEVKRRLNNIVNYDLTETSAQDFLKRPTVALRQDIRVGYGPKNSKARKAFERAEKEFGEFAEQKGKKSIRSLRTSERPESVAGLIRTPSGLADVKSVVSPEQFSQIERELLEYLRSQNQERAAALYKELRPSFTEDANSIAEQIIESKAPKASATKKASERQALVDEALKSIARSTITLERPTAALNLWKTVEGQQLIKNELKNNPNEKEVLKYLQDQSFKDFAASIVDAEGKIDFKKLDKMSKKDPATAENLRLSSGEDAYQFLKNLEILSSRVKKNASILEDTISKGNANEREKIRKVIDKRGKERFERLKEKNSKLSPEEQVFKDNFGKEARLEKAEAAEAKNLRGQEKFRKSREKRESKTKEILQAEKDAEQAALEAEKKKLIYKLDDLVKSYGVKAKGMFSLIGVSTLGPHIAIPAAVSYELVSKMAKSKTVRDAIKKAASPHADAAAILQSFLHLEEMSD